LGFGDRDAKGRDDPAFKSTFSPEFRNRLDARIGFDPLTPAVMGRVVDKFVKELSEQLSERNVTIELSAKARDYLADKGYDKDNGARPLARLIQDEIKRPLGDELLFGRLEHGGRVRVDLEADKLVFNMTSAAPPPKPKAPAKPPAAAAPVN
jgi:ATP-dependent Clp protease ATP-binding subunit ClpA